MRGERYFPRWLRIELPKQILSLNTLLLKHNRPAVGKAARHNPYFLVGVSMVAVPFISAIRSPRGPCTLFAINALILYDALGGVNNSSHAQVVAQERPHTGSTAGFGKAGFIQDAVKNFPAPACQVFGAQLM